MRDALLTLLMLSLCGCREEGLLQGYKNLDVVRGLRSFKSIELKTKAGEQLSCTKDFLTSPGSVMLVHSDPEVVRRDAEAIHTLAREGKLYICA